MLALLILAQAASPVAIDPVTWLNEADYPPAARRDGAEGRAGVDLRVDRAGRVIGCDIALSTGRADLDEATCRRVRERGRFRPARTAAGKPTEDAVRLTFSWKLQDHDPVAAVNEKFSLRVVADGDGTIRDCVQEGRVRDRIGFDCGAPMLPNADQLRLLRVPSDRPFVMIFEGDQRFDGRTPAIERRAGAIALSDATIRFSVDADGRVIPCGTIRDEGRLPYRQCEDRQFRFVRAEAGAPPREGMLAIAVWFIDGGTR